MLHSFQLDLMNSVFPSVCVCVFVCLFFFLWEGGDRSMNKYLRQVASLLFSAICVVLVPSLISRGTSV